MSTLLLLIFITIASSSALNSTCNDFQATFDVKKVIGTWHVVAVIPEKSYRGKEIACYKVEFSETDGAGLHWLMKKKGSKEVRSSITNRTIVRQRYHTEHPFDVWSKSVQGVSGCFQPVLYLDIGVNDKHKTYTLNATMQLHLVENKENDPYLLQILWFGRAISVIIYKRHPGVTQDQLKPVIQMISKLRGPQRLPEICVKPLNEISFS